MPDATQDLRSFGRLAVDLQISLPRLRRALELLGVAPALRLNEIEYYNAHVADDIYPLLHSTNEDESP